MYRFSISDAPGQWIAGHRSCQLTSVPGLLSRIRGLLSMKSLSLLARSILGLLSLNSPPGFHGCLTRKIASCNMSTAG